MKGYSARRVQTPRRRPILALVLVCAWLTGGLGCASLRYGFALDSYQGQLLRIASEAGARALEIESGVDPALRNHVSDKGPPDYIFVESDKQVFLIYVARDELAIFSRRTWPVSSVTLQRPISQETLELLEKADRKRVVDARARELASRLGSAEVRQGKLTLADGIQRCFEESRTGRTCDVVYTDGIPTMIFDSAEDLDGAIPGLPGVAREYCRVANETSRMAIVTMTHGTRAISFSCELGRWGDWMDVKREGVEL